MHMSEFIDQNRSELQARINHVVGHVPATASCSCPRSRTDHYHESTAIDDDEIRLWILNDEGLYRWARAEGVRC